jgi:hypothetical protein
MARSIRPLLAFGLGCTLCALAAAVLQASPSSAAGPPALELVTTIPVEGGPDAMVVDCCDGRNDLILATPLSETLRFIDGNTLQLAPVAVAHSSWSFDGWLAYDRINHLAYALQVKLRYSPNWQEAIARVISSRTVTSTFSINMSYNPTDTNYVIDGLAFKQPASEGDNPGRLIVDNTYLGNIDVVDLNITGTAAVRGQRHSYRDPMSGIYHTNAGNSLALETQHNGPGVVDLDSSDMLYIADHNDPDLGPPDGYGFVTVLTLTHPLSDLVVGRLPDLDLNDTWPYWNGVQGLAIADQHDTLYVASAIQSFDNGYVALVDTTDNQLDRVVQLTYADPGFVLVDWYDPKRVFVTTFDGWYNDPDQGLYLHLLYDGVEVDSLLLERDHDEYNGVQGMAFDPYHGLLYIAVGNRVMVVRVNYGAAAPPQSTSGLMLTSGGSLELPDGSARVVCPAGAFSQPTLLSYTESSPSPTGDLIGVRFFELTAVISGTSTPVTVTNQPCTMRLRYSEPQRGAAIESTLAVYQPGDASLWSREGITSTVNGVENRVSAQVTRMGASALLGETERVYLPLILRHL